MTSKIKKCLFWIDFFLWNIALFRSHQLRERAIVAFILYWMNMMYFWLHALKAINPLTTVTTLFFSTTRLNNWCFYTKPHGAFILCHEENLKIQLMFLHHFDFLLRCVHSIGKNRNISLSARKYENHQKNNTRNKYGKHMK